MSVIETICAISPLFLVTGIALFGVIYSIRKIEWVIGGFSAAALSAVAMVGALCASAAILGSMGVGEAGIAGAGITVGTILGICIMVGWYKLTEWHRCVLNRRYEEACRFEELD